MEFLKIELPPKEYFDRIGFAWHTDGDGSDYVAEELLVVSQKEAEAYYEAVNELYDMYVEAAQYVIDNDLFFELGIPFNLIDAIKRSWEEDVHWHLYGRFDLAGGIDGKPIKLLEFNADTPTALFETAIVQWVLLRYNDLEEAKQFNRVYEAIKENFQRLVTLDEDVSQFGAKYEGWRMLFSSIAGSLEDENTTRLLQTAAAEAGWNSEFCYVDEVGFGEEGIFYEEDRYEFWFKLIPWESIAIEEPELALILSDLLQRHRAIVLNPAYTLLFQSKGMLPILWKLFPNHPLLLEASFEPLEGKKQVEKKLFGREGENIAIYDRNGEILERRDGEYGSFPSIYQEFTELPKDSEGRYYQAGVFFAYEGCGLGFRRGGAILDNRSKFVGHVIK